MQDIAFYMLDSLVFRSILLSISDSPATSQLGSLCDILWWKLCISDNFSLFSSYWCIITIFRGILRFSSYFRFLLGLFQTLVSFMSWFSIFQK